MFGPLNEPGVYGPLRHKHRHKCETIQTIRDICPFTVFFNGSLLISTAELLNISQRDRSKWCVIARSILRPLLRNVREEFTAPNGDTSGPCVFQLCQHSNSASPLPSCVRGRELDLSIRLATEQVQLGF